jgi:c(7)-type cytochrome triheme protein
MRRTVLWLASIVVAVGALVASGSYMARAEFGDMVINNYSDQSGIRPVVFPHWFHRIRFSCKVCHTDLGFAFKVGGNDINMLKIFDGESCGACHDGQMAWGVENCILCHSGKPGLKNQAHNSTGSRLVAPVTGGRLK